MGSGGNRIKRRLSNSAPGLCQAVLGWRAQRPGWWDSEKRERCGGDPRSGDLGEGGWGAALPSQTCLFPLPPCWKNPGSIWLLKREGGREGDGGSRLPPRVSLEKGGEPPQETHLSRHTPEELGRVTMAREAPGEGLGHLPGLQKIINRRKKNKRKERKREKG